MRRSGPFTSEPLKFLCSKGSRDRFCNVYPRQRADAESFPCFQDGEFHIAPVFNLFLNKIEIGGRFEVCNEAAAFLYDFDVSIIKRESPVLGKAHIGCLNISQCLYVIGIFLEERAHELAEPDQGRADGGCFFDKLLRLLGGQGQYESADPWADGMHWAAAQYAADCGAERPDFEGFFDRLLICLIHSEDIAMFRLAVPGDKVGKAEQGQ